MRRIGVTMGKEEEGKLSVGTKGIMRSEKGISVGRSIIGEEDK